MLISRIECENVSTQEHLHFITKAGYSQKPRLRQHGQISRQYEQVSRNICTAFVAVEAGCTGDK